jgi:type I restriction enzyme S subunit
MEVKAGYKRTEAGVIPQDWDACVLGDGINLVSGQHVLTQHCNTRGDGVPYLTGPADFPNGSISHTKFTERPSALCKTGDILVTVKGSGSGTLVMAEDVYCISRQLMAIRVRDWDSRFVYYSLAHNAQHIKAASTGLIPGLSRSDILGQILPMPQLSAQQAIAAALRDVDALLARLDRLITKTRDIKQATMQQLLTGQVRLLGFARNAPSKQTELGSIPADWEVRTLRALATMKSGASITAASIDEFSSFPCYGGNGLRGYTTRFTHSGEYSLIGRQGALCGNILGVRGQFFASEHAIVVTALPRTDIGWLTYVLTTLRLNRLSESSAQPGLSVAKILGLVVVAPPTRDEQRAIATVLSDMDGEIAALEKRREKTHSLKQAMMQELLTGRTRLL